MTVIGLLLVAALVAVCSVRMGAVVESVSQCAYIVKPCLFAAVMIACTMLVTPSLIERSPDILRSLAFAGMCALGLAGASPLFRDRQKAVHYISAIVCAVCLEVLFAVAETMLLMVWMPAVLTALLWRKWWCLIAEAAIGVQILLFTT